VTVTRIVCCVVGTRPEAVKLAPVIHRLRRANSGIGCRILATGQHQQLLSDALADFGLVADRNLGMMRKGQSLPRMTGRMLVALSAAIEEEKPDLILAVGDTTTVLASALSSYYAQIPFGHVEAGLRTGQPYRPFPEEKNRELSARLASLHFAPTRASRLNLIREGISTEDVIVTGNTVIDALRITLDATPVLEIDPPGSRFVLVTAHRRENWGPPMVRIAGALRDLVDGDESLGLIVPAHPNPRVRRPLTQALGGHDRVRLIDPLPYRQFVAAMAASAAIVTDSGGVQEEGTALGRPVLILRPETERPEVVETGGARLVGTDRKAIVEAIEESLRRPTSPSKGPTSSPLGDGRAAERIVRAVQKYLGIDTDPAEEPPPPWPPAD
jgi:UDP-N-acetylglucosamine 2-epimerase (non-hydrolysing)